MKTKKWQFGQDKTNYQRGKTKAWALVILVLLVLAYLVLVDSVRGGVETPGGPGIEIGEAPLFPEQTLTLDQDLPVDEDYSGSSSLNLPGSADFDQPLPPVLDKFAYFPLISNQTGALSVNPADRQESLDFYRQYYLVANVNPGWTGDVAACNPGTTSQAFRDSVTLRINYFRAMAGVPAKVTLLDEYNQKAQKAALMMSAKGDLSHDPSSDWPCYTAEGHEAAGSSNLALGGYGLDALRMYMQDFGSGNSAVGHRRWILYPQTQNMGTGDIPGGGYWAANDLWVFDSHMWEARPTTRETYVAWPPPGYVPYTIVFPRWSFSYAGANFGSATVNMTENGDSMTLTPYPPAYGYGENTLVWIRNGMSDGSSWPKPLADTTYVVTISNVLIGGSPQSFQYTVIVFDPG